MVPWSTICSVVSIVRALIVCLLVSLPLPAAAASNSQDDRDLIEALERMAATGEPHHNTHDAGELLQKAVDAALQYANPDVERAAIRAAAQITASVARPVVTPDSQPVGFSARLALNLPRSVTFTAEISGSIDGGPLVLLGHVQPGAATWFELPAAAQLPGAHHLRLRAYIVYEGSGDAALPEPETRDLPELAYAVYDPSVAAYDARVFRFSPANVSANALDRGLPDVPFWFWLNTLLVQHGSDPLHEFQWNNFFCDERTKEPYAPNRRLDICAVVLFGVGTITTGEIWIRTGRIDYSDPNAVQWLASPPTFEALRFVSPESSEVHELWRLEQLLVASPDTWPAPDVSVNGEDIVSTPACGGPKTVRVKATLRNAGDMDARNVYVELLAGDPDTLDTSRHFVVDVPAHGAAELEVEMRCSRGYGLAYVSAFTPLSDYSPVMSGRDDPTPRNNVSYRIINPERMPKAMQAQLRAHFCANTGRCRN